MWRKSFKAVFTVLLVFVLSFPALALPPQDALSVRPSDSVYAVTRVDNLNGLLQKIFSPANIEMVASLAKPEDAQGIRLVASFASQIPAKSVAVVSGVTADKTPFMQLAASMPDAVRDKLNRVADGSASGVELVTLLLGDGGLMLATGFEPEVHKSAGGTYYTFNGAAFAAKDDLLLIASSQAELAASLGALEKSENRLVLKRRFDDPNYFHMHIDAATLETFAQANASDDITAPVALANFFKAPLELELAFSSKPGSFLLSSGANALESLAASERYKAMKPANGAGMFLAGGGKILAAASGPTVFRAVDFKVYPEFAEMWNKLIKELERINITEGDAEDLLNGNFTMAFGSDATVTGKRVPGGYAAITGRNGVAAKILERLMADEKFTQAVPMAPLKADGWDSAFTVDPALSPVPLVVGVTGDTLFVGAVDPASLGKAPELPPEAAQMFEQPLFGMGVVDTAAIWDWLRQEVANPDSLISSLTSGEGEPIKLILHDILEADLAVPVIKIWAPELEESFLECSIADVPADKRLLPRLISLAEMFIPQPPAPEDDVDDDMTEEEWLDEYEEEEQ